PDAHFPRLDNLPRPGGEYLICVRPPFVVSVEDPAPWIFFQPALSATNDWTDYPHEIPLSGLVRVAVSEVATSAADHAWLAVKALESLALPGFVSRFPTKDRDYPLRIDWLRDTPQDYIRRIDIGPFCHLWLSADVPAAEWAVCQRMDAAWHLLLYYYRDGFDHLCHGSYPRCFVY